MVGLLGALTPEEQYGGILAPMQRGQGLGLLGNIQQFMGPPVISRMQEADAAQQGRWQAGERSPTPLTEDNMWLADDVAGGLVGPMAFALGTGPGMADNIAKMLRQGRAAEVTDEMLGALGPNDQRRLYELYESGATGMDLPMDEASRMGRAAEQGYTPSIFHGTAEDVPAFDPSKRTRAAYGQGLLFGTSDPDLAGKYAAEAPRGINFARNTKAAIGEDIEDFIYDTLEKEGMTDAVLSPFGRDLRTAFHNALVDGKVPPQYREQFNAMQQSAEAADMSLFNARNAANASAEDAFDVFRNAMAPLYKETPMPDMMQAMIEEQWKNLQYRPDEVLSHWAQTINNPNSPDWMKNVMRKASEFARYESPVEGANVIPMTVRGKNAEMNAENLPNWQLVMPEAARRIEDEALDYFTVRNVLDTPVAADYSYGAPLSDVYAISNPANIRSRHARFDPRLKHNADLLASLAGAGFLGSMAYQPDEAP